MFTIVGTSGADDRFGDVTINGWTLTPDRSLKVRNHSPTGFSWGYLGSGPAQLALAILLEAGVPERKALTLYQQFKLEHIAVLPQGPFSIQIDVMGWVNRQQEGN